MANDTIFALSTGLGKAGIAIIRVSGRDALNIARKLTGISLIPRAATVCYLRFNQELIDQALVVFFKAGSSYTGEDLVEFHIHGGSAVISHLPNISLLVLILLLFLEKQLYLSNLFQYAYL